MVDIIRADLVGSRTASACGITVKGRTPILTLCRALLKAGHDPASPLHCYRGDTLALTVPVGDGAKLTVKEDIAGRPPHFAIYRAPEFGKGTDDIPLAGEPDDGGR